MKKLTILLPDTHAIGDLSEVLAIAIEFKMETLPDPPKRGPVTPHTKHVERGLSTKECVLAHYTPEGVFTKELTAKWLKEKGFAATSASPVITELRRKGHLTDIGPGKYRWIKGA